MKIQKILFIASILLLFQCSLMISNTEQKKIESIPVTLANNDLATTNDCFDQKMGKWFQAFTEYQNQGYDMKAADFLSVKEANLAYQDCSGITSNEVAEIPAAE